VFRRTLGDQEICNVLAALDTADSPSDLLSVVHSMPTREVSEFTRVNRDD
jgi:hypothetical protein